MRRFFSILFSRYFVSALLILFEIAILLYLVVGMGAYSALFFVFMLVVNLLVLLAIINAECNPEYRVTWIAIVLIVPIFGAIIYILFSRRRMSKGEARLAEAVISEMDLVRDNTSDFAELEGMSRAAAGRARAILGADRIAEVYSNTAARYYSMGREMYLDMLSDIRAAKEYVFLEYFIIDDGVMWRGIREALIECISRGVEVRLIYDDVGCMNTMPPNFAEQLIEDGIRAVRFAKVSPVVTVAHNNRDHRKICVIDGRVAYTGGVNIADEYIGERAHLGVWKDGGVRVEGEAAEGFLLLFLVSFDTSSGCMSDYTRYIRDLSRVGFTKNEELSPQMQTQEPNICDGGFYIPFGSGPRPLYPRSGGKRAILDTINQAESYVYITTPYLIIDFDLTEALAGAAERGVDVRIITPGVPDKRIVKIMTKSSYLGLISRGVKIYEYTPGFMHHKLLVSDDMYAMVGTINLDYRSLVHHFEDALWTYGSPIVGDIRDDIEATLAECHYVTAEEARLSLGERLIKCALRLFSPLF